MDDIEFIEKIEKLINTSEILHKKIHESEFHTNNLLNEVVETCGKLLGRTRELRNHNEEQQIILDYLMIELSKTKHVPFEDIERDFKIFRKVALDNEGNF